MKMNKKRFEQNYIIPCSNTNCVIKDCPNYSKDYKKGSFFFPDCMHNPNKLVKNNDTR